MANEFVAHCVKIYFFTGTKTYGNVFVAWVLQVRRAVIKSMRNGETCTNFHPGKFLHYHSSTIIFTLICVLPRRNTSTEHQKLWCRHLHLKITILTQILSRVNQTGSTRHCFDYISKQDGDIKCPKNCSDTSNPKQYFKAHCSLRQHWRIPFHSNNIWIIPM